MQVKQFMIRVLGILGVLGGLTMFVGDMLFYYEPSSTDLVKNMGNVSDIRIIISGVIRGFTC